MNPVLTMGGLVAVILLYRVVDSYFKDKGTTEIPMKRNAAKKR